MKTRKANIADLVEILEVERQSFPDCMSDQEFQDTMDNGVVLVAESGGLVVGYLIYFLSDEVILLESIAVHPSFRRQGHGGALMSLVKNLAVKKNVAVRTLVRDSNLAAHEFLRGMGLRAVKVLRNQYEDSSDDTYVFEFRKNTRLVSYQWRVKCLD